MKQPCTNVTKYLGRRFIQIRDNPYFRKNSHALWNWEKKMPYKTEEIIES